MIANGDAQTIVADEQVRRIYLGNSFGEGITDVNCRIPVPTNKLALKGMRANEV